MTSSSATRFRTTASTGDHQRNDRSDLSDDAVNQFVYSGGTLRASGKIHVAFMYVQMQYRQTQHTGCGLARGTASTGEHGSVYSNTGWVGSVEYYDQQYQILNLSRVAQTGKVPSLQSNTTQRYYCYRL